MRKLFVIAFSLLFFSVNANAILAVPTTPILEWTSPPENGISTSTSGNGTDTLTGSTSMPLFGQFTHTFDHDWVFSLEGDADITVITSAPFTLFDMVFTLDGSEVTQTGQFSWENTFVGLDQSTHILNVKGAYQPNGPFDPSFGESDPYEITVNATSPVPVPAAFWLFGSAILGVRGFAKYRKSMVVYEQ
jgi:hypothetical protein